MTERNKMRMITFYYYYALALSVFTSFFFWFDASVPASWLRLVLLLAIPLLILRRSREKQQELEKKGKKLPECHFGFLLIAGFVAVPGSMLYEREDNFLLSCILYAAAIGLYFAEQYIRGRYLLLYCNPSVSVETRRRFGDSMRKYLVQMVVMGLVLLIFFLAASLYAPEVRLPGQQKTNTVQQEQDNGADLAVSRREDRRSEIQEEQEKKEMNPFLVILRYILLTAIAAMGIGVAVYALFRLFFFLLRGRKKTAWEFEEMEVVESDNEEYIRLVPVSRRNVKFPEGNDGRIRREFYREIRRQAGDREIVSSQTPVELKAAWLAPDEKGELLTELYEKARYAKDSVTPEEIDQWENL